MKIGITENQARVLKTISDNRGSISALDPRITFRGANGVIKGLLKRELLEKKQGYSTLFLTDAGRKLIAPEETKLFDQTKIQRAIEMLKEQKKEYADPRYNDIGKLNIVAFTGERVLGNVDMFIAALESLFALSIEGSK